MRALILVDLQNDFMPGGALAVPDADQVIPVANRLARRFTLVVASRDWHPPDHGSLVTSHPGKRPGDVIELGGLEQILWPAHCLQGSPGARFVDGLELGADVTVFDKGTDPEVDSYSCFFDNAKRRSTGLDRFLKERDVRQVYLLGVATDYCVKFSALDAAELGFETLVVEDGCRGIDLQPGDVERAFAAMEEAGVRRVRSDEVSDERGGG